MVLWDSVYFIVLKRKKYYRKRAVVWQLNSSKISSGLEKPVFFCQILSNIHRLYSAMCGITGAWRDCVMKVSVSKSKNQTIYYLSKSVWIDGIISINQKRWQIEECFRIMKSEFQARPVYLSRKDRITAHLVLERITRLYLKEK